MCAEGQCKILRLLGCDRYRCHVYYIIALSFCIALWYSGHNTILLGKQSSPKRANDEYWSVFHHVHNNTKQSKMAHLYVGLLYILNSSKSPSLCAVKIAAYRQFHCWMFTALLPCKDHFTIMLFAELTHHAEINSPVRGIWSVIISGRRQISKQFPEGRRCKKELFYSKSHFSLHVKAKQRRHIVWFHKHKIELKYV